MALSHVPALDFVCSNAEGLPFADQYIDYIGTGCHDHVASREAGLHNSSVQFIAERLTNEKVVRGLERNIGRFKKVKPPLSGILRRSVFFEVLPQPAKLSNVLPNVPLRPDKALFVGGAE